MAALKRFKAASVLGSETVQAAVVSSAPHAHSNFPLLTCRISAQTDQRYSI